MACMYCHSGENDNDDNGVQQHVDNCPDLTPRSSSERAEWNRGYELGRSRKELPEGSSDLANMGWCRGDSAADSAENGHDPRWD
jgi:hypothetical protein